MKFFEVRLAFHEHFLFSEINVRLPAVREKIQD